MLEKIWKSCTKVLVTGGFGYIGAELVKQLVRQGIDYVSVDKKNPATRKNVISLDLCDRQKTAEVIGKFNPDVLIHCGTNSALAYRDHFLESFREDAIAIANIIEALSKLPGCRLVYFSSSYCYSGLSPKERVTESVSLQPSHNFGVAKSFFEQLVLRSHPSTVIFRLSSVFGSGNAINPNAVFNMAKECLETGTLTVWGTGSRKMQYVYMQDVLNYICEAFTLEPGIYNLGGNEYFSVAESASMISDFFGARVVFLKDKREGEMLPFMDTAKLKRISADHITPFRDSLKKYLVLLRDTILIASSNQISLYGVPDMNTKIASYEAYMSRVSQENIPCYEPSVDGKELELLADVIRRNWLSEGKYTREFEDLLARLCERKYSLAFSNATAAMIVGMKSLSIGPGDEVIVPSFTHSADPNSIAATGATPVFADVDETTLCLSVKTIDAVKTTKTRAILYVALYGNSGDIAAVADYAKKNNLFLINDCAAALCSTYMGKQVTSFGDFAVLSFFADKSITTGEGGMLLTGNTELLAECNIYKHDGRRERGVDLIERRGFNFRITELQAAVGVAQLSKLSYFIKKKKEILKEYQQHLSKIPEVQLFRFSPDAVPHRALIFVPDAAALISYLTPLGIGVRTTFMPMHSQPCYRVKAEFPVTKKLYATGVCLPSAPTLNQEKVDFICNSIENFYAKEKK